MLTGLADPEISDAAAASLIREAYLTPASLAAVVAAIAKIPGVRVTGEVTDEAGRLS